MTATVVPPFPLSSEDADWWAFPADWKPRDVVSELAHNLTDWLLDDVTWVDDDDHCRGWFAAYRKLIESVKLGYLRPYDPARDLQGEPDWWFECEADEPGRVEAQVLKL